MKNLNTSLGRIVWLFANEFKLKRNSQLLVILSCFGFLSYLFFNPNFQFTGLLDSIVSPTQAVRTDGYSVIFNNRFSTSANYEILKFHFIYFPRALFIVGFIVTSLAFTEYSEESSRRFYLSIPASNFEKWISKTIWYSIVFPISFYLIYQIFTLITYRWGSSAGMEYVKVPFFDGEGATFVFEGSTIKHIG